MNKLWKGIGFALLFEVAAVGVLWAAILATGTVWVWPLLVLVGLPLLACTFPQKERRWRRY